MVDQDRHQRPRVNNFSRRTIDPTQTRHQNDRTLSGERPSRTFSGREDAKNVPLAQRSLKNKNIVQIDENYFDHLGFNDSVSSEEKSAEVRLTPDISAQKINSNVLAKSQAERLSLQNQSGHF